MSDPESNPLNSLLSSFALGPAWARAAGDKEERKPKTFSGGEDRPQRGGDRGGDRGRGPRDRDGRDNRGGGGGGGGGGRPPFQRRDGRDNDRRNGPPSYEEAPPAEGIRTTVSPDQQAVHLIGKEVHQVARVYPLFDVAKILLAEKARCRAVFEAPEPHAPLIIGKITECVFLTREEAMRHLWNSDLRNELVEEETIEVEPPTGNFQAIARCGISGEWLGPVNFHSYQTNLRRLHRERFSNMPFEIYASKVRTERGEEAVNAWLETMKKKTRWRIKGDADDAWIEDRGEAERAVAARCFDQAFSETRLADVSAAIPAKHLSPSLLTSLKIAGSHARKHPAILIPAVCRAVEAEHLPVFKRQGKLHTGPARPHPLPPNAVLAERPSLIVAWIRENSPAKLEGLWKAVLPEGSAAPPAEYAADLFWLLQQGHILLYTDDTLVVQEAKEAPPAGEPGTGAKKKKKKKSKKAADGTATAASTTDAPADKDATAVAAAAMAIGAEAASSEAPAPEASAPTDSPDSETAVPAEVPGTNPADLPAQVEPVQNPPSSPEEAPAVAPEEAPETTSPAIEPSAPEEVPAQAPAGPPSDLPDEVSTATPSEVPAETPSESPSEASPETPVEIPGEQPSEPPAELPGNDDPYETKPQL